MLRKKINDKHQPSQQHIINKSKYIRHVTVSGRNITILSKTDNTTDDQSILGQYMGSI